MNNYYLLVPIFLPVVAAIIEIFIKFRERKSLLIYNGAVLVCFLVSILAVMGQNEETLTLTLVSITDGLVVYFHVDTISKIFACLVAFVWLLVGLAAFEYMGHEKNEKRFYMFYVIVGGVLAALCFAGNLFTMYLFYELMTLTSMPLVIHSLTHEAIMAAIKYLFYSVGGAFLVLFGFFVFAASGNSLVFTPGGGILGSASGLTLAAVFCMILGFGTKAGMFPMHGWLPTAHPVAPAPASAVLSGIITKAGVLGIIRVVYFIAGPDLIRGTWVQYTWMGLALTTVFMGSMLAYRENVLKKRMAYSTVSQVSYVLFGLSTLNSIAFVGAIMHVIFHSLVKNTLFVSAGAIIYKTGRTKVDQLLGIGKEMPVVMWCFTLVSLTLIGIPPTSAFVSKWYLATGAIDSGVPFLGVFGPIVLLISAVLTAGYLLTISIKGFLPGNKFDYTALKNYEPGILMLLPLIVMTVFAVVFGIWPAPLIRIFEAIASAVL